MPRISADIVAIDAHVHLSAPGRSPHVRSGRSRWPSTSWEREALAVALHKPNAYIDLSGWAPRYMSAEVRTYVNSRVQDKALFGSDWPVLEVDRWLTEFDALDFKPAVREKVLLQNAKAALGLEQDDRGGRRCVVGASTFRPRRPDAEMEGIGRCLR